VRNFSTKTTLIICLFSLVFLTACSSNKDDEKSADEQFTDKQASKIVKKIKQPLVKAEKAQDLANQRLDQIQKAADKAAK